MVEYRFYGLSSFFRSCSTMLQHLHGLAFSQTASNVRHETKSAELVYAFTNAIDIGLTVYACAGQLLWTHQGSVFPRTTPE